MQMLQNGAAAGGAAGEAAQGVLRFSNQQQAMSNPQHAGHRKVGCSQHRNASFSTCLNRTRTTIALLAQHRVSAFLALVYDVSSRRECVLEATHMYIKLAE